VDNQAYIGKEGDEVCGQHPCQKLVYDSVGLDGSSISKSVIIDDRGTQVGYEFLNFLEISNNSYEKSLGSVYVSLVKDVKLDGKLDGYSDSFNPVVYSNLGLQDWFPLFGLNLQQMK
jgi:hypothetical protein